MTQASSSQRPAHVHSHHVRRLLAATCTAGLLALAGLSASSSVQPTVAQALEQLDTSKLPRPPAVRQLAAFPQTTIFLSAEPVPAAAKAALTLLEANGWQRYLSPGSNIAQQPTSETHLLKKGPQALNLFVQTATAHNNATSVSYTAMPLARDLPLPEKATDIQFSPDPLHLDATATQAPEALLAFYRTALAATGWTLHSASDGSAAMRIPTGEGMQHAFFTHSAHGALHATVRAIDSGRTSVAIRSVPASVLPGAQVARPAESAAPQPNPQAAAHAQMSRSMDAIGQDLLKQALQPPAKSAGIESALADAGANCYRFSTPFISDRSVASDSPLMRRRLSANSQSACSASASLPIEASTQSAYQGKGLARPRVTRA